jgi:hypothetical protein
MTEVGDRWRRRAARVTAKEPASVSLNVHGQLLRWAHRSPWSEAPLYHDPNDLRVEQAIRAFHDRGYRLVSEEPSSIMGSVGGASFEERAITLVFLAPKNPRHRTNPRPATNDLPHETSRFSGGAEPYCWRFCSYCACWFLSSASYCGFVGYHRHQRARGRLGNDRFRHDYPADPRDPHGGRPVAEPGACRPKAFRAAGRHCGRPDYPCVQSSSSVFTMASAWSCRRPPAHNSFEPNGPVTFSLPAHSSIRRKYGPGIVRALRFHSTLRPSRG